MRERKTELINSFIYPEDPTSIVQRTADGFDETWKFAAQLLRKQIWQWADIRWNPPSFNYWKLNTDGSAKGNPGIAGAEGIFRDSDGNRVKGYQHNLGQTTAVIAELWGLLSGLELAWELGCRKLHVELDSEIVCKMVHNQKHPTALLRPFLRKITQLLDQEWDVSVHHIYRESNFCADWLANNAWNLPIGLHVCNEPPTELLHLLMADISGATMPRLITSF